MPFGENNYDAEAGMLLATLQYHEHKDRAQGLRHPLVLLLEMLSLDFKPGSTYVMSPRGADPLNAANKSAAPQSSNVADYIDRLGL